MNRAYNLSGRFTPIGVLASVAAGLASGFPVAAIYAWGIIQIPEERLACLATISYGALLGAAVALAGKWGKVRNIYVGGALASGSAAISFYCSWAFWVKDILHTFNHENVSAFILMQQPHALWEVIQQINQYGTWGTSAGKPTTGTELWVIWACEGIAVLGTAAMTAVTILQAQPFCERCQLWCSATEKLCLSPASNLGQIKLQLQSRDLSFLQKLGPGNKNMSHLAAELHSCRECHELNTLTLRQTFIERSKFGKPKINHVSLAAKLLLSCQEADLLRDTAQGIKQLSKATNA
jgi:hypothetical protein